LDGLGEGTWHELTPKPCGCLKSARRHPEETGPVAVDGLAGVVTHRPVPSLPVPGPAGPAATRCTGSC
jgi:hypothetical protein